MMANTGGSIVDLGARVVAARLRRSMARAARYFPLHLRVILISAATVEALAPFIYAGVLDAWTPSGTCWPARHAAGCSRRRGREACAPPVLTSPTAFPTRLAVLRGPRKRSAAFTNGRRSPATRARRPANASRQGRATPFRAPDRSRHSRRRAHCGRRMRHGQMCLDLARADRVVVGADLARASLVRVGARGGLSALRPIAWNPLRPIFGCWV